jgi:signal-transduction protein with cAMP-binding, CBS, and nucleotidyltransferase domain
LGDDGRLKTEDRLKEIEARLKSIEQKLDKALAGRPAARPVSAPPPPAAGEGAKVLGPADAGTVAFLSRSPLFARLTPWDCAKIAEHCEEQSLEEGAMLFSEGEYGDSLYVIKEGLLEIFKKDGSADLQIAILRPGAMVGEMALVEGKPRSANVRAVEQARLLSLSKTDFDKLKKTDPQVATKFQDELLLLFSNRLRATTDKLVDHDR